MTFRNILVETGFDKILGFVEGGHTNCLPQPLAFEDNLSVS